jgi:predicted GH43/DUF377 family glycosyl hydrolase
MDTQPFELTRYLTPHKLGEPVLTGSGRAGSFDELAVDCPYVFWHDGTYQMLHVGFDGTGYQTGLATSTDLRSWTHKGVVLSREGNVGWDSVGAAGTWILRDDNSLWAKPTLAKVDGRYWMVYHSYPGEGYESGPAEIGLAWCEDEDLLTWHRLEAPVFTWRNGDEWDRGGLYKGCLIAHDGTYYLFYNAKNSDESGWVEQTGVATSPDMMHWTRHQANPVLRVSDGRWDSAFCSDPFVARDGDVWIMFYFGFDRRHAQEGIAWSRDLLTWNKHPEPIIAIGSPDALDEKYAHKPALVYHEELLYHFYVASRKYRPGDPARGFWDEFRTITFATSVPG